MSNNANPCLQISAQNSGKIKKGKTGNLVVILTNSGPDPIGAKGLIITIAFPPNVRALSVSKVKGSSYKDFSAKFSKGAGNYVKLTTTRIINGVDGSMILINVQGVALGGPMLSAGQVAYVFVVDPLTGLQYALSGNQSSLDDNSLTSWTVI